MVKIKVMVYCPICRWYKTKEYDVGEENIREKARFLGENLLWWHYVQKHCPPDASEITKELLFQRLREKAAIDFEVLSQEEW